MKAAEAHEAIGDALASAFRKGGYSGSSVRDLTAATGLKSASLYHRFGEGKPAMALAALDQIATRFEQTVLFPLKDADNPASTRLATSAAGVRAFYDDGRLACLLAVMVLSGAPEPVRDRVAALFDYWQNCLAAALDDAGIANAPAEAEDRIAAIQGALVMMRADPARGLFARAIARLGASG